MMNSMSGSLRPPGGLGPLDEPRGQRPRIRWRIRDSVPSVGGEHQQLPPPVPLTPQVYYSLTRSGATSIAVEYLGVVGKMVVYSAPNSPQDPNLPRSFNNEPHHDTLALHNTHR
jgi:hypothetical protein